jgi:hypothetical protein
LKEQPATPNIQDLRNIIKEIGEVTNEVKPTLPRERERCPAPLYLSMVD